MELPENLENWTFETIVEVVGRYEYEPSRFDFKEVLIPELGTTESKKEHSESIRRTACAMANTDGGYILFGVVDREKRVPSPEARILGIPRRADLRKQLGDKLEKVQPAVSFDLHIVDLPTDTSRVIAIAHVPLSPLRPHQCITAERFYRRDAGGKAVAMNVYEVRDQMLYSGQRLQQIKMLRLELHSYRMLRTALRNPNTWFVRFDIQAFKVLLAQTCDLLPEDGELLAKLQGIATMAGQFNFVLEQGYALWRRARYIPKGMPGSPKEILDAKVQQQLNAFDEWCVQAQDALTQRFGPLPLTDALWPMASTSHEPSEAREGGG